MYKEKEKSDGTACKKEAVKKNSPGHMLLTDVKNVTLKY